MTTQGLVFEPGVAQPKAKQGYTISGRGRTQAGSVKSQRRLSILKFDPIEEKVKLYRKIMAEIERMECIRAGTIVELYGPGHRLAGKEKTFKQEDLNALLANADKCVNDLLRYGYGRVPELVDEKTKVVPPMMIELSREGEVYIPNPVQEEMSEHESDDFYEDDAQDNNGDNS